MTVGIADLTGVGPRLFSYSPPVLTSAALASNGSWDATVAPDAGSLIPVIVGGTAGSTIISLSGSNFGPGPTWITSSSSPSGGANASGNATSAAASTSRTSYAPNATGALAAAGVGATGYCVFLSWTFRGPGAPAPLCNAIEDFIGEGELPWAVSVLAWDHEAITFVVGPGAGSKDIILGARGGLSLVLPASPSLAVGPPAVWRFRYAAPVLYALSPPVGSTSGGDLITLSGDNFGPTPINTTVVSTRLVGGGIDFTQSLGLPVRACDVASGAFSSVV